MKNKTLLLLLSLSLFLGACGSPATSPNFKLQFLDATTLAKVRYADIAIFSDKITCAEINQNNYASEEDKLKSARVYLRSIKLDEKQLAWLDSLPPGQNLIVYILGISFEDGQKKMIAHGCQDKVTLTDGQIANLNVKMNNL